MKVPIDEIQKGDFVCMWKTGFPEWWGEVIQVVNGEQYQYQVRYWNIKKNQWDYFPLHPDKHHNGMIKEVLRVDPAVAVIFRSNMKSTV